MPEAAARRLAGGTSLHRQLLVWLLLPQLVLWIVGAVLSYQLAARYANAAIDASLSQATRALARQVKPIGNGLLVDFPRAAQDILEADPDDRVLFTVSTPPGKYILGNRNLPPPQGVPEPPRLGEPYFYDGETVPPEPPDDEAEAGAASAAPAGDGAAGERQRVRVAALYLRYGEPSGPPQTLLVQVARDSANREQLARHILSDTVLPLSALIVLMTMIVWAGIRAGLAPLARLRRLVEGEAPNDLTPIELDAAPREVRALARAINALLAAVQHNVTAQKRFISDAAHQLRTPLAGLKSQTELALLATTDPDLQARLQRVHTSATRSAHLVNQLLTLARAEPESASAQSRVPVDLRALARELCAEHVPRARQAGIDLGFEDDGDTPVQVVGIPLLLREALGNLLDNALRYAGSGAEVTVRVGRDERQARVEVEDTGPGLPASLHEGRAFERFVRGSTQGDGCGLGLAIVREIVQRHSGQVDLSPRGPHGLRVCIRLPLRIDGAARHSAGPP